MIIKRMNEEFEYKGKIYKIGAPIVGTDDSEYKGLFGRITEIRTDKDKLTDNETPDIYCSFDRPLLQQEINDVEARFSELYGEKKWIDDIILDEVILSPDMVKPLPESKQHADGLEIFIVKQEWSVDGECDSSADVFTDYDEAKHLMHEALKEDMANGIISRIEGNDGFVSDESDDFYEGYIDGEHNENFYMIEIKREKINIADDKLKKLKPAGYKLSLFDRFPMERLVGRRYETLDALKKDIEEMTGKKVGAIWESSSERPEGTDYMIDYEFELFDIYTLFYLRDTSGKYYITEV